MHSLLNPQTTKGFLACNPARHNKKIITNFCFLINVFICVPWTREKYKIKLIVLTNGVNEPGIWPTMSQIVIAGGWCVPGKSGMALKETELLQIYFCGIIYSVYGVFYNHFFHWCGTICGHLLFYYNTTVINLLLSQIRVTCMCTKMFCFSGNIKKIMNCFHYIHSLNIYMFLHQYWTLKSPWDWYSSKYLT